MKKDLTHNIDYHTSVEINFPIKGKSKFNLNKKAEGKQVEEEKLIEEKVEKIEESSEDEEMDKKVDEEMEEEMEEEIDDENIKKLNFLINDGLVLEEELVGNKVYVVVEKKKFMDPNRAKILKLDKIHPSWKDEKQLLYYTSEYPENMATQVINNKFYSGEFQMQGRVNIKKNKAAKLRINKYMKKINNLPLSNIIKDNYRDLVYQVYPSNTLVRVYRWNSKKDKDKLKSIVNKITKLWENIREKNKNSLLDDNKYKEFLKSVKDLDEFIKFFLGPQRKRKDPLIVENSEKVGGFKFGKQKNEDYLLTKYYWMETKIEYALSRPIKNYENIDGKNGNVSQHNSPKAIIAVIRYPNGDFDLRIVRQIKETVPNGSEIFVNKPMGIILHKYGWMNKKNNQKKNVVMLNKMEINNKINDSELISTKTQSLRAEEIKLGDGIWDVLNDPNYAPPDAMKPKIRQLLERNDAATKIQRNFRMQKEMIKMKEEEIKKQKVDNWDILKNLSLKRVIVKNDGNEKRVNRRKWPNSIDKVKKFFDNGEKKKALKGVKVLRIRVSEDELEIFDNVIQDLFKLYKFDYEGGYKLKRRSMKKYKKIVYMKDKTRRKPKFKKKRKKKMRGYKVKSSKRTKRRKSKKNKLNNKKSKKNKYVLTYIKTLTQRRRKYN